MTLLQSMEGKYYDVPEEQATSFEVPREKVRELMAKAGPPATQGAPGAGPGSRPGGPSGPPPGGGGSPVIIQVLPNGIHGPASPGGPGPSGGKPPSADEDDEVDPYWWVWRNFHWGPYWRNQWMNW